MGKLVGVLGAFAPITALLLFTALVPESAMGVQIVTENPAVYCEELHLAKPINVYKDPTLFMGNLSLIYSDPQLGWERLMEENPLLTRVQGLVRIMKLGPPRYFRNFGGVAALYEAADPRFRIAPLKPRNMPGLTVSPIATGPEIIPIKICGQGDAYTDSLGFVLTADLEAGLPEGMGPGQTMRPSTLGNPIPKYSSSNKN